MNEQDLLSLCNDKGPERKILYWPSEVYGIGKALRRYAFYPDSLPLNIYSSHGITHADVPAPHELEQKTPAMLFFSPRLTREYKKRSDKYCATIICPYIFYRKANEIEPDKNAAGTIAFPSHSTPEMDDVTDYKEYCSKLRSLPEEFHPLTVCLHYHDINKGLYKVFTDHGFEVVTAGNVFHPDFIDRFYEIIRRYKFVTSNQLGSYAYYAVEMGTPFLLYGNPPVLVNVGDENIEKGPYQSFLQAEQMKKALEILGTFSPEVTVEQKRFVEEELGVYHSIGRFKAACILYNAYFRYVLYLMKLGIKSIFTRSYTRDQSKQRGDEF